MDTPLFGPAGSSESFAAEGHTSTLEAPAWLQARGLTAYEYQCGHGVRVGIATAQKFGAEARARGVAVSLHAPYYISLASEDPQKRDNSVAYILQSARLVAAMGGERVVVHPGGLGGRPRPEAAALAAETLRRAQEALDGEGLTGIRLCPETMGKIRQLGDLDEVLFFCGTDERFLPCVDFGHLNARTLGGLASREDFAAVLDAVRDRLGEERARRFHIHFSRIEFSKGGEKRHLTFAGHQGFGPEPEPLMELIARRGLAPVVICESAGTQAEDAAALRDLWLAARSRDLR